MQRLGLFARHWTPGEAKTRLAAHVGPDRAARLHLAFLTCSLERLADVDAERTLAFTPAPQHAAFERLAGSRWQVIPQAEGDLGNRLEHFLCWSRAQGSAKTVLVGSDTPTLAAADIERAFEALEACPVTLGPTDDGGYYLLGVRSEVAPPIFANMPWGTSEVWRVTTQRLADASLAYAALPRRYDIDTVVDLERLVSELRPQPPGQGPLAALQKTLATELDTPAS